MTTPYEIRLALRGFASAIRNGAPKERLQKMIEKQADPEIREAMEALLAKTEVGDE